MLNAFLALVVSFLLSLIILAGFGFYGIYVLGGLYAVIPVAVVVALILIFAILVGVKIGLTAKRGIDELIKKIDEIVKKVKEAIKALKEASLMDVIKVIWKVLKDLKNKDKDKDKK